MAKMKTLTVSGQTYTVMDPEAVSFVSQNLTSQQQRQARENIGAISTGEADSMYVRKEGTKNLFNPAHPDIKDGYAVLADGQIVTADYLTGFFLSAYIGVKGNTAYSLSPVEKSSTYIAFYNEDKAFISAILYSANGNSENLLSPADAKYCRFTGKISNKEITMLEEGACATAFEEYGGVTLDDITAEIQRLSAAVGKSEPAVCYTAQDLTAEQQACARENIGAVSVRETDDIYARKAYTKNLFNANDPENLNEYAFIADGAVINSQHTLTSFVSHYIEVKGNTAYSMSPVVKNTKYIVFYDENKAFISTLRYDTNGGSENLVSPSNAKYCRFTGTLKDRAVAMFQEGTAATAFVPYGEITISDLSMEMERLKEDIDALGDSGQVLPTVRKNKTDSVKVATLQSGEHMELTVPDIKQNNRIAFYGKLGSFDTLTVSHGKNYDTATGYVVVDGENLYAYKYGGLSGTYPHGLTFTDFVAVEVHVLNELNAEVTLSTGNGGMFKQEIAWNGNRDVVKAELAGGTLTNCGLSFCCGDYDKDVWAFGDSYFDLWPKILNAEGAKNWLLDGFAGRNSAQALASLQLCLTHGTPRYLLWCMGMNDPDSENAINASWKTNVEKVLALCEENNITPILATIPNTPIRNHRFKNGYIKSLAHRYVDVCDAVGADNDSGAWYDGMLSADQVHPAIPGRQAIACRTRAEVPEIME